MPPLISVIVPCYNQAKYLPYTLQCILNQTHTSWECIIVNDGSTDNSHEIAASWPQKDARFIYIHQENKGLSAARNAGLKIAKGEYIQFLDADDLLAIDKFSASIKHAEGAAIIITNYGTFGDLTGKKVDYSHILPKQQFSYNSILLQWDIDYTIPIHCGLFKRSLFDDFLFNETLKAKEDWLMWLHVFAKSNQHIFIDTHLALYRMHNQSMTKDFEHMKNNLQKVYTHLYATSSAEVQKLLYQKIVNLYLHEASKFPPKPGFSQQDYVEVEQGKRSLGFVGSILFKVLRKVGHVALKRQEN